MTLKPWTFCGLTVLLLAAPATAQTIEVRNGDGAALQTAFQTAPTGSTILIYSGTYQSTNNGGDPSEDGGFALSHDGVIIKAAPGQPSAPLLTNCPVSQTSYCVRPTITALNRQNVTIEGLRIHGGIWITGSNMAVGQGSRGLVLRGNDIDQGWGEVDDGNWAGIWLQNITGGLVVGNTIHNISVSSGGGQQSSGTCIKLFQNTDTVVENNTCRDVTIPESQSGGIDDKAQATRNIHRFNWIENVNACIRINNQLQSIGDKVYGNVCIAGPNASSGRPGVRVIDLVDSAEIYNNTFIGFPGGLWIMNEGGPIRAVKWYNNIVAGATASGMNVQAYQLGLVAPTNYNAWTSGPRYLYAGAQNTFTQWKARGFDANGLEVDCQVSSTTGQLAAGSPCRGVGRVGGVSTGAAVDLGAFGVTTCVGATCPPPPPTCTFTVAPTSWSIPATASTTTITATASDPSCARAASSEASWLSVAPASGTGTGSVTVTAQSNPDAARSGTVTVAGQVISVTQAAVAAPVCTYTRTSPATVSVIASGTSVPIQISTDATCVWAISTSSTWMHLSSTSNTGPGQVTVFIDANAGAERTGTVQTADQTTTFIQSAAPPPPPAGGSYTACITVTDGHVTAITTGPCAGE